MIVQLRFSSVIAFFLIYSMSYLRVFVFWGIEGWFCWLCVLLLFLGCYNWYVIFLISSVLTKASCSAWFSEHLLCSAYLNWCFKLLWINIAVTAATPCSLLLPSVSICIACSSCCSIILTESAGWSQSLAVLRGRSRGLEFSSWCCSI